MAVPKHKVSRMNRGNRRSHDGVAESQLSECSSTGRTHLRHHMTEEGIYRGKVIVKESIEEDEE